MKAGIITAAGRAPVYGDFGEPTAGDGNVVITVAASALSHLSKARSSGSHYSSDGVFPSVAGVDGVGRTADGPRVYFAMPESPYGALAEKSLVRSQQCIPVPDSVDDVTAAAIANPGMAAWASLMERAHLKAGETVLINGATGTAGTLTVQLAKYLGAGKIIAAARSESELRKLTSIGADITIPFSLDAPISTGAKDPARAKEPAGGKQHAGTKEYEQALIAEFSRGIDVVIDYLWGVSARTIIAAIARGVEDGHPVRFVQVGAASREDNIDLPAAALRSSAIQLMGSGIKSVPFAKLLAGIGHIFDAVAPAKLQIATKAMPLSEIEEAWKAPAKPRIVVTIP